MINELQQTAFNNLSEMDFNNFMKIHRKCKIEPCSFLLLSHESIHYDFEKIYKANIKNNHKN